MNIGSVLETEIQQLLVGESTFGHVFEGIMPAVKKLYVYTNNLDDLFARPRVAIVGSRRISPYGKAVTEQFAGDLAKQGIVIISGLAYGVDAVAHQAALDAGGLTIAVLPGSIEKIYPTAHTNLARRIVEQGGALISEYPAGATIAWKNQFVERNRIVSGMSDALLITEAADNSGTMHTARFALEQGKDVLAVPGNITSEVSRGTNNLIKVGAAPATSPDDVLHVLGLTATPGKPAIQGSTIQEQMLLNLLSENINDGQELLSRSQLPISEFNQALTMMELTGKIRPLGVNNWTNN
jgi:DNA processing protein